MIIFVPVTSNGRGIHHSTVTCNTLCTQQAHSISRSTCVFIKNCITIAKHLDPNKHRVQCSKLNKCLCRKYECLGFYSDKYSMFHNVFIKHLQFCNVLCHCYKWNLEDNQEGANSCKLFMFPFPLLILCSVASYI